MESLIAKLHKRKDVIGQSNLIAGLVENYTEDLTDFATVSYASAYYESESKKMNL